jgi:hypothetical protein
MKLFHMIAPIFVAVLLAACLAPAPAGGSWTAVAGIFNSDVPVAGAN